MQHSSESHGPPSTILLGRPILHEWGIKIYLSFVFLSSFPSLSLHCHCHCYRLHCFVERRRWCRRWNIYGFNLQLALESSAFSNSHLLGDLYVCFTSGIYSCCSYMGPIFSPSTTNWMGTRRVEVSIYTSSMNAPTCWYMTAIILAQTSQFYPPYTTSYPFHSTIGSFSCARQGHAFSFSA